MSKGNVQEEMSKDVPELTDDELALPLEPYERQLTKDIYTQKYTQSAPQK